MSGSADKALGQRRVAGAENPVGQAVDAQLGFHRGLDVDLGQDPEALGLQRFRHLRQRTREVLLRQDAMESLA